jgi:hypothetical protein
LVNEVAYSVIATGTAFTPDRFVADHQDDGNDNDNGVVDDAKPQLTANRPKPASPGHGSVTHQASPVRVNTEITKGSANYVDLDVTKEVEDKGIDVFAKGDDDDDTGTRSMKRSRPSAISCNDPASDSDVSVSGLQDGQHDSAQSPQLDPAIVSLQQSDLTNNLHIISHQIIPTRILKQALHCTTKYIIHIIHGPTSHFR